jgi:GDSL-like Lipase/Acylhydrolase family
MRRFAGLCVAAAVALAVVPIAGAPAAAAAPHLYVALGDSYTAGPLIPQPTGDPIDCGRSTHNYPHLVAKAIAPGRFLDVSCGSATTRDMRSPQTGLPLGGTNPPQFDALSRRVDLVTVGIGGNDMGFGDIVTTCVELGLKSLGAGQPCTDHYTPGGYNQVYRRLHDVVGPHLRRTFRGIERRAPHARLLVVGYPDPVPQAPGCYPVAPLAPGDLPFLHGVAHRLDRVERRRARAAGADYVELLPGSIGHDICQLPGTKWYEGIVPTSPAYPAHPNALGEAYAARRVLSVLGAG